MKEYILYRLVFFLARLFPLRVCYMAGGFCAFFYYHFFRKKEREILKENLRVVFSEWDEKRVSKCARRNFTQFGKFIAEFFYMDRLDRKNIGKLCRIKGGRNADLAAGKGRGVIALSAHAGNWELGGAALSLSGRPVHAIALDHGDKKVNNIFITRRERQGIRVIPAGRSARDIIGVFRRGGFLAVLGDRDTTSGGMEGKFFGRKAVFPRGAPALARRFGAPVVIGMCMRQADGLYTLFLHGPFEARGSGEEAEREVLEKWLRVLERYIRKYPEQWFMYHRVWGA